jgi:hypothetical protein
VVLSQDIHSSDRSEVSTPLGEINPRGALLE